MHLHRSIALILALGLGLSCSKFLNRAKGGGGNRDRDNGGGGETEDNGGTSVNPNNGGKVPVPRRLTPEEYQNSVQDVLGVDVAELVQSFPLEASTAGFRNQRDALEISLAHVRWFGTAAEKVAALATWGDCSNDDAGCLTEAAKKYTKGLYRRPLTDDEQKAIAEWVSAEASPVEGARMAIAVAVQAPTFLYRFERGKTNEPIDGYELAARLSFFLWHSVPDESLIESAASGELASDDELKKQVQRMLEDPKAKRGFRAFVAEWLQMSRLDSVERDPAAFPGFDRAMIPEMKEETLRLFETIAFDQKKPLQNVFNAEYTFATPRLASLYGLDNAGEGYQRYKWPDSSPRRGLFTMSAFLTLTNVTATTDPVARGHFVSDRFLCIKTKQAPKAVSLPDESAGGFETKRERYEVHRANKSCEVCHRNMDPIGFAFEPFDAIGKFRTHDESDSEIDDSGLYPDRDGRIEFSNAVDLAEKLAASPQAETCIARRVLEYALGEQVPDGSPLLTRVVALFARSEGRYEDLIAAVLDSSAFRQISSEGTP